MKKYIVLMIVVSNVLYASSQDIIFRNSTDSIIAQVMTINDTEITYRKWSNLSGPVYAIRTSEVDSIRYMNGETDYFQINQMSYLLGKSNDNFSQSKVHVFRSGNTYIYGDSIMNKHEMAKWLYDKHSVAYSQFKKGLRCANFGWFSLATGLSFDIFGGIIYGVMREKPERIIGAMMWGVGGLLEIICIPALCIGYSKMHSAVEIYNVSIQETTYVNSFWTIQVEPNGIGIAYHF